MYAHGMMHSQKMYIIHLQQPPSKQCFLEVEKEHNSQDLASKTSTGTPKPKEELLMNSLVTNFG